MSRTSEFFLANRGVDDRAVFDAVVVAAPRCPHCNRMTGLPPYRKISDKLGIGVHTAYKLVNRLRDEGAFDGI